MKYFLVSRDGSRTETAYGGGHTVFVPWVRRADGRLFVTHYEHVSSDASGEPEPDKVLYYEGITRPMYEKREAEGA